MIKKFLNKTVYRNHMTMSEVKAMLGKYKIVVGSKNVTLYDHTLAEMMLSCEYMNTDTFTINLKGFNGYE